MLNKNEKKILEVIVSDPFISQQSIANELGLTRSTVATIISGLTQKKHLLGRAYVINQASNIYCIGAMNVDRKYNLWDDLVPQTSNPATPSLNAGGVARNIAESLGRLQLDVSLISLGGHDQDYQYLKRETEPYVNMQHTTQLNGYATGTYNAVLDPTGEMQLAIENMQIYEEMTVEWLSDYQSILQDARFLVIDLNLPLETVEYLLTIARHFRIDTFIITVGMLKMNHLPTDLTGVTWLVVDQDESETYFDIKVESDADVDSLVERWLEAGVENVVVTQGAGASIYGNLDGEREVVAPLSIENVVDVTGTKDAYSSGIIYGYLNGYTSIESFQFGITNAYLTIQSKDSVRTNLSKETFIEEINQLFQEEIIEEGL